MHTKGIVASFLEEYLNTLPAEDIWEAVYKNSYDKWVDHFSLKYYNYWVVKKTGHIFRRFKSEQYHDHVVVAKAKRVIQKEYLRNQGEGIWTASTILQAEINKKLQTFPYSGSYYLVDIKNRIIFQKIYPIFDSEIKQYKDSINKNNSFSDVRWEGITKVYPKS